jgi:hypothetical protein
VPRDGGRVLWNGKEVDDPATFLVPPRVAYLPQVPRLFSETLAATVLLGLPDADLDEALAIVAAVPSFKPSIGDWAITAMNVRDRWPGGDGGIGVPTWFYGHEPPNVFAGGIAKFFQNSVREATLLNRCDGGVVFLPGAAGTVQEIFQDACENYYAEPALVAPMVLVGREHWTERVPAWPLLEGLATAPGFRRAITVVDTIDDAARFIAGARSEQ